MLFEPVKPLILLKCEHCRGSGAGIWRRCKFCKGMVVGTTMRQHWLFWDYPLERYHIALQRASKFFNKIRRVTTLVIVANFFLWAGLLFYRSGLWVNIGEYIFDPLLFFLRLPAAVKYLLNFGVLGLLYFWYRVLTERQVALGVEHHDYSREKKYSTTLDMPKNWAEVFKLSKKKRFNIAKTFEGETLQTLADAYRVADKNAYNILNHFHLFYALLSSPKISNVFLRLGISAKLIQQELEKKFNDNNSQTGGVHTASVANEEIYQILFNAYEEAFENHQEQVAVTELLVATVKQSAEIQEILYNIGVDKRKLLNVVEWVRIRERLRTRYELFRRAARHRSTKGMDRAMTAVATPYLNQFSDDLTIAAQFGYTGTCVARDKEIEEIFRVVNGGEQNVLLVGDYGTGKKSIVEGVAERMIQDDVPDRLKDKRLIRLSVSSLLSGTTPSGAVERLINIMNEISRARNIILFIHDVHELIGVSAGSDNKSLDVAGTLAEYISGGRFMTIATTTAQSYVQHIANSNLSSVFAKVEVGEMDENQAIQVLESKVGYVEYKNNVFFSYEALAKAVEFSKRFIRDIVLPGSALEVMAETAVHAHGARGNHSLVSGEDVAAVIAAKTKIPVTSVSLDETQKLLHLEEEMHKRVVGQDEAVDLVANALRRARAQMRSQNRPIASFLFLGPTGVGKTELAKTIADIYFGGEERMVRFDMSEYQEKSSIYRLIGAPGEKGTGLLTEAARKTPFALLLLDELEKADKDVLNLFLQVLDDGRLTDSSGRVADFTNVILIATSNAGTSYVQEQLKGGLSSDAIKDRLMHGGLKDYFRPEFLNRFDGIVLFQSLDKASIKKIAGLMLKRVTKDLDEKGVELKITDEALEFFAQVGFDPDYGARPLRRAIQERVENNLAELVLGKKLQRGMVLVIGEGGKLFLEE